jgi:sn-glycerol 3-phosphate transport system permease protein
VRPRPGAQAFRHVALVLFAAIFAAPLYLALVAATRSAPSFLNGVPTLPGTQLGNNLDQVFGPGIANSPPLGSLMANSAVMALGVSIGKLVLSIPAAFAVAFFRFRGRMVAFWLIFATLMLPVEVRFFPTYQVTAQLGMLNSFSGLVIPLVASATAVFLFRQFFMTFPLELADAARLDGIRPLGFLWRIVLPLSKPNLAAVFVLEFIYGWNQYLWPLLVTSGSHATVVMGIREMISAAQSFAIPQWNLIMTVTLLALAPPVVVVVVMQRWFVKGLTAGIS